MNHEIEDHGDVRAAWLKWRQALGLEKPRLVEIRRRGADRAIEPLHMAHLQHHFPLVCHVYELLGARQGIGQWLLDQRGQPSLEDGEPDLDVRRRRDHHRGRFNLIEQRIE